MPVCKFERKYKCKEAKCDERCKRFRQSGQQLIMSPKTDVVQIKTGKGYTAVYYRVEKDKK